MLIFIYTTSVIFLPPILAISEGLKGGEVKSKKYPNEGMWRTLLNGVLLTIIILPFTVIMVLFSISTNSELTSKILLFVSRFLPLMAVLTFGFPVIQNLILPIIFFLTKKAP